MSCNTMTKEAQQAMSPQEAIDRLKAGNERFLNKEMCNRDLLQQVDQTSTGQAPFAVVLGCIDSRVPAELVFDQGIGDIFNCRVAGNFVNDDILGSMEFSCKLAGSKAIVVLGHAACGAIKGACDHAELGLLTGMLENLQPAVGAIEEHGDRSSANADFVQKVVDMNVVLTVEAIVRRSSVLREMHANGEIAIVGAMYDISTGKVHFNDPVS